MQKRLPGLLGAKQSVAFLNEKLLQAGLVLLSKRVVRLRLVQRFVLPVERRPPEVSRKFIDRSFPQKLPTDSP